MTKRITKEDLSELSEVKQGDSKTRCHSNRETKNQLCEQEDSEKH